MLPPKHFGIVSDTQLRVFEWEVNNDQTIAMTTISNKSGEYLTLQPTKDEVLEMIRRARKELEG